VTAFPKLFEPIRLGSLELKNRIVFPAITTYYDTHFDLKGTERSADFYTEIARGGAGLIIIAGLQAIYPGRRDPPRVAINHEKWIPHLNLWAKAAQDNGAKIAAQLAVWNYWAPGGEGAPAEDVSPSGVVTWEAEVSARYKFNTDSRVLTVPEIHAIEQLVGEAARRAREAGYDAVEIPAVAGNLINRFLTPYTNRRTDEYGGSLENRLRFLLETIASIKAQAGADFPIIARVSGDDMMPWGLTPADATEFAPLIEAAGAAAISTFAGWYESRQPKYTMQVPRGAFNHLAAGVKSVVRVPVCANIRINDPRMAEDILAAGEADLVAMGRALVADPEMPNKARDGRVREIRFCTGCCTCLDTIMPKEPLRCAVNARAGDEAATAPHPVNVPKQVWVIGGGPGGMEAARLAALRGHRVTLFEKDNALGGQLRAASIPPGKAEWHGFVAYQTAELERLGVEVKLGVAVDRKMVLAADPEALILATGAVPWLPPVEGLDPATATTAVDVLLGQKPLDAATVIVVGGGLVGCETAEFLVEQGKQVTILEMLPEVGADIGPFNRRFVLNRLEDIDVRCVTGAKVAALSPNGVVLETGDQLEADAVIFATGTVCDDRLLGELNGLVPVLLSVGDCTNPRGRVRQAVATGYHAGLTV
jgi:2,4-dienoyl-CoA reductase (NADPH2)